MRARVQIIRNNEIVSDRIWKDKKGFIDCTRSHGADKIHLDVDIESIADIVALSDWCNRAYISFKK